MTDVLHSWHDWCLDWSHPGHSPGEITAKQSITFVLLICYKSGGCGFKPRLASGAARNGLDCQVGRHKHRYSECGTLNKHRRYSQRHITVNTNDSVTSIFCAVWGGGRESRVEECGGWSAFPRQSACLVSISLRPESTIMPFGSGLVKLIFRHPSPPLHSDSNSVWW